jgi:hypothetical protein
MSEGPNPSADRQFRLQRQAAESLKAEIDAQREHESKKKKQTQTIPPIQAPTDEELKVPTHPILEVKAEQEEEVTENSDSTTKISL